jgi:hypothetical protein
MSTAKERTSAASPAGSREGADPVAAGDEQVDDRGADVPRRSHHGDLDGTLGRRCIR